MVVGGEGAGIAFDPGGFGDQLFGGQRGDAIDPSDAAEIRQGGHADFGGGFGREQKRDLRGKVVEDRELVFDADRGVAEDGKGLEVAAARRGCGVLLGVAHVAGEGDEEFREGAKFEFPLIEQGIGRGEAAVVGADGREVFAQLGVEDVVQPFLKLHELTEAGAQRGFGAGGGVERALERFAGLLARKDAERRTGARDGGLFLFEFFQSLHHRMTAQHRIRLVTEVFDGGRREFHGRRI